MTFPKITRDHGQGLFYYLNAGHNIKDIPWKKLFQPSTYHLQVRTKA